MNLNVIMPMVCTSCGHKPEVKGDAILKASGHLHFWEAWPRCQCGSRCFDVREVLVSSDEACTFTVTGFDWMPAGEEVGAFTDSLDGLRDFVKVAPFDDTRTES